MAQVAHLKGPEKDGKRDPVYFASHVDFVEGLDEKLENEINATSTKAGTVKLYDTTGNNTDGAMTQSAVTSAINAGKTKLYSSTGSNTDGAMTQSAVTSAINAVKTKLYSSTGSNTDGAMTQSAVSDALNTRVPCPTPTAFILATSAWTRNSSETSEFVYYADIAVSGLTANDYAEVNFTRASQSIVATANLCPSGDTMSGKIRIYAKNVPSASINGEYVVTKGAD